jgi:hypothetical protein
METRIREIPILFSTPMVRAILDGRKIHRKIYKASYPDLSENEILALRIANGVKINKNTGCWEWQKTSNGYGYGTMTINGKSRLVTRLVYSLINGSIPDGKQVLHDCDNPCCCNPEHLHLGTRFDNMRECYERGRSKIKPVHLKGEKNGCAKLTEEDVIKIRNLVSQGERQHAVASLFSISQAQVSNIVQGRKWAHV